MNAAEFKRRIAAAGIEGRAVEAARLVLVDGVGVREAARRAGLSGPAAVTRTVARIESIRLCRTCGQAIRD